MTELDDLLDRMAVPLGDASQSAARHLAEATMPRRMRRGRGPRARWVLPVVVGSGLLLTAGAGTAAITMAHWGGVEMPLENVRNQTPLVIDWEAVNGEHYSCQVWIELRHAQSGDGQRLDAAIGARNWSGVGQRLYEASGAADGDVSGTEGVYDELEVLVRDLADATFPGIHWLSDAITTDERAVDAWGVRCDGPTR